MYSYDILMSYDYEMVKYVRNTKHIFPGVMYDFRNKMIFLNFKKPKEQLDFFRKIAESSK